MADIVIVHGVQFGDDKDAVKGPQTLGTLLFISRECATRG